MADDKVVEEEMHVNQIDADEIGVALCCTYSICLPVSSTLRNWWICLPSQALEALP